MKKHLICLIYSCLSHAYRYGTAIGNPDQLLFPGCVLPQLPGLKPRLCLAFIRIVPVLATELWSTCCQVMNFHREKFSVGHLPQHVPSNGKFPITPQSHAGLCPSPAALRRWVLSEAVTSRIWAQGMETQSALNSQK